MPASGNVEGYSVRGRRQVKPLAPGIDDDRRTALTLAVYEIPSVRAATLRRVTAATGIVHCIGAAVGMATTALARSLLTIVTRIPTRLAAYVRPVGAVTARYFHLFDWPVATLCKHPAVEDSQREKYQSARSQPIGARHRPLPDPLNGWVLLRVLEGLESSPSIAGQNLRSDCGSEEG